MRRAVNKGISTILNTNLDSLIRFCLLREILKKHASIVLKSHCFLPKNVSPINTPMTTVKKIIFLLVLLINTTAVQGQFIKEKSINALIGYAISVPYNSTDDIADSGFYVQGELVLQATSWFELRPYLGYLTTSSDGTDLNDNPSDEKATTKAFFLGGKARVRAPIPYVAPYLEIGLGTSIGTFETTTFFTDITKKGVIFHIPIAFGLELGKSNNVDLGLSYYIQPSAEQVVGGFAIGITIPLRQSKD